VFCYAGSVLFRSCLVILSFLGCAAAMAEEDVPVRRDWVRIRSVISEQIEAFRRDDGQAAFSYASPGIREVFGTPGNFMEMVKTAYPAVYRPVSFTFLESTVMNGAPVQTVQISDNGGAVWIAIYTMQRQKDSSWKVNGCTLLPAKAVST
jgi:hypothetical protein